MVNIFHKYDSNICEELYVFKKIPFYTDACMTCKQIDDECLLKVIDISNIKRKISECNR